MPKFKFAYVSQSVEIKGTATAENEAVVRTSLSAVVIKPAKASKARKASIQAEEK